jgi:transcription elongation factor Elf1
VLRTSNINSTAATSLIRQTQDRWGEERVHKRKRLRRNGQSLSWHIRHLIMSFFFPCARPVVPTVFKCCMCNHDDAVECDLGLTTSSSIDPKISIEFLFLDLKNKVGNLTCRICGANFQAEITCKTRLFIPFVTIYRSYRAN